MYECNMYIIFFTTLLLLLFYFIDQNMYYNNLLLTIGQFMLVSGPESMSIAKSAACKTKQSYTLHI